MLHRLSIKGFSRALTSTLSGCGTRRTCVPAVNAVQQPLPLLWKPTRGLSDSSAAPTEEIRKPDWAPGTPPPGRAQTIGEAFAAMQHHARGTRKVKASVLNGILKRVSSEEELKYAALGLKIFKAQKIDLQTRTATKFVKACCRVGSPQTAVDILGEARKYGLDPEGVVSANRFNYLLSQLYAAGDSENFTRAVAEARSRRQVLNARTHKLITGFEEEVKAKEEEAARVKAEEERAVREAEEEAKREEEQLLAKEAAAAEGEAQRVKDEEELKAKEVEEAAAKMKEEEEERKAKKDAKEAEEKSKAEEGESAKQAEAAAASEETTRSARDVDVPSPGDRDVEQDAAAEAQDGEAKR
ncbi:unnamed protein product [Pylaiella littoralis]